MPEFPETMLGPGRPEATCDDCFRLLDEFTERQHEHSDAATTFPELAAHLEGCPVCREEYDSLLTLLAEDSPSA